MSMPKMIQLLAVVFSLAAALICYELMLKHVTGTSGAPWFEAGCGDEPGSAFNCEAVLASPYSYIPPKHPDEPDRLPHLPAAFIGLVYYSALALWFIGIGRPAKARRRVHLVPMFTVGLGLLGSAYFTIVMLGVLNEWCPWCLATHILNVLIAIAVVLMWPRSYAVTPDRIVGTAGSPEWRADRFDTNPSARQLLITVLAIALTAYGELNVLGLKSWKRRAQVNAVNFQKCKDAVERITGDAAALVAHWQSAAPCDIDVRSEDPVRTQVTGDTATQDVVVFSDFLCPMCRKFAPFMEEQIQPLFGGRLRVVFRHYPLDAACNPQVSGTMHPQACRAAAYAEAARIVGGNVAFWKIHDYLFAHAEQMKLKQIGAADIVREADIDDAAFRSAFSSEAILTRIQQDAELARACQTRGTPSVFVEGRPVDVLAVMDIRFWDKLADLFWKRVDEPRPPETQLVPPDAKEPAAP